MQQLLLSKGCAVGTNCFQFSAKLESFAKQISSVLMFLRGVIVQGICTFSQQSR